LSFKGQAIVLMTIIVVFATVCVFILFILLKCL